MAALGDWLTTKEAAGLVGYHQNHIRRLIHSGNVIGHKWGNTWMVDRESLLAYVRKAESAGAKRGPKSEDH